MLGVLYENNLTQMTFFAPTVFPKLQAFVKLATCYSIDAVSKIS